MLRYHTFTCHPQTTAAARRRTLEQNEADSSHPERVRGSGPAVTTPS
jgi:hypothetical protein